MVALGYGKYARATDIVALIPIEDDARGDGRRTYVYVAGLDAPLVASRTERAILADMEHAPNLAPAAPARSTDTAGHAGGSRRWRRPGSGASATGRRRA
ncbi:MAG: hypothetical protein QOH72_159 [Solirubrobacteraceae bacterium]|nr:hypothetical protein [Solirubrobacteraceae bacterium]